MVNFISIQFSIFGTFIDIKATTENILKVMNKLESKQFLPNTFINQNVDLNKKTIDIDNRISFITQDQFCNFVILNDRIDVNFNITKTILPGPQEVFNDIKAQANNIYKTLIDIFNLKSNRLALNVKLLGSQSIQGDMNHFFNNSINGFSFYKSKEICEWSYNVNTKHEVMIDDNVETLNVITNLGIATNLTNQDQRLLCHFDINTIGENQVMRFGLIEIISFSECMQPLLLELIRNFEEFDKK